MIPWKLHKLQWLVLAMSVGVAAYALVAYSLVPLGSLVHPQMKLAFEAHRVAILTHIFCSALAMVLGPWQFVPGLRARRPVLHRWSGRMYLLAGVVPGGITGLYVSSFAFGGYGVGNEHYAARDLSLHGVHKLEYSLIPLESFDGNLAVKGAQSLTQPVASFPGAGERSFFENPHPDQAVTAVCVDGNRVYARGYQLPTKGKTPYRDWEIFQSDVESWK